MTQWAAVADRSKQQQQQQVPLVLVPVLVALATRIFFHSHTCESPSLVRAQKVRPLPAHLSGWCASVVNVRCQLRLSFRCGARRPWPEGLVAPWNFSSDLGLQFFFSASLWPTTLLLYPWLSTLFSFFLPLPWLLVFLCFPFPALPPHSGAIHLPLLTTEAVMAASICHCCLSCSCCCDYQNHGCFCLHGCGSQDCHCYHPAAAAAAAAAATIDPLLS